jgi:CheY-like chemotaxis protein
VLGGGNVFTVVLPARPDLKVLSPTIHQQANLRPGKGKILIMDDKALIRALLAEVLWKCGYTFDVASDGVEAIALFRQAQESGHKFVAVILNLTVPGGMGGKETIKKMRELDPNVRAIVSSGYANDPVMEDFRGFGFDGIVTKPFDVEQLSEVLHQVMFEGTP